MNGDDNGYYDDYGDLMIIVYKQCTNSWVITAVVSNSQTDLMHHTHDNNNHEQRFPWKVWVTQLNGLVLLLHFCQDVFSHRVRGCVSVTASYCVCVSPDIDKPASMTQIIALLLTVCSHFWRSCLGDNYMFDWVTVWLSDWVLVLIFKGHSHFSKNFCLKSTISCVSES